MWARSRYITEVRIFFSSHIISAKFPIFFLFSLFLYKPLNAYASCHHLLFLMTSVNFFYAARTIFVLDRLYNLWFTFVYDFFSSIFIFCLYAQMSYILVKWGIASWILNILVLFVFQMGFFLTVFFAFICSYF